MPTTRTPRLRTLIAASAAIALVAPASADAARYASDTSSVASGDCSTEATACAIEYAVEAAAPNDEIVVLPGTYDLGSATLAPINPVTIRGRSAAEKPLIVSAPAPLTGSVLEVEGGTVRDVIVEARNSESAVALQESSVGERIVGKSAGGVGIQLKNGTNSLRDSLAVSTAAPGAALQMKDGTNLAIGVTAIGAGGANGFTTKIITGTGTVKNSIVSGALDYDSDQGSPAVFSSSNWRRTNSNAGVDGGENQTDTPVFCALGDPYRPDAASPTRDKGVADAAAGATDLAGLTRPQGDGIDIGAYEHVACPTPPPPPANNDQGGTPGTDTDGDGTPDSSDSTPEGPDGPVILPPASKPVLGSSVTLGDVKGTPLVRVPGSNNFVPLTSASTVPLGAVVDATNGTVALTSVRDKSGKLQTGEFWSGVFKVGQSKRDAMTELTLVGGGADSCRRGRRAARTEVNAAARRRWSRRLWGRDRGGRFRTRGRHGSATVRGTRWLTEDRCDGTFFKVTEGAIDVRDEARRKTVRLKRGKSYLAPSKAALKRKKRSGRR